MKENTSNNSFATVIAIANVLIDELGIDVKKVEDVRFEKTRTSVTLTVNLKQ